MRAAWGARDESNRNAPPGGAPSSISDAPQMGYRSNTTFVLLRGLTIKAHHSICEEVAVGIVRRVTPGSRYTDDGVCAFGLDFWWREAYAHLELSSLRGCGTRASFTRYRDGKERP